MKSRLKESNPDGPWQDGAEEDNGSYTSGLAPASDTPFHWPEDPTVSLATVPLGWALFDSHGKIVKFNDTYLTIMDLTREEAQNIHFADRLAPEHKDVARKQHQQRMQGEAVTNEMEYRYILGDDREVFIRLVMSPIEQDGMVIGTQSLIYDITPRNLAENALQEQVDNYRNLVEGFEVGIVSFDSSGRVRDCNDQFLRMLGRTRADLIAMGAGDFLAPVAVAHLGKQYKLSRLGNLEPAVFECEALRKDGSEAWLDVKSIPRLKNGEVCGIEFMAMDISNWKDDRQKLNWKPRFEQEQIAIQSNIIKSLPGNILLVDWTGDILSVSQNWRLFSEMAREPGFFQFKEGSNFLQACRDITGPNKKSALAIEAGVRQVIEANLDFFDIDGRFEMDGEMLWFKCTALPVEIGRQKGVLIKYEDITSQMQEHQELESTRDYLEELVDSTGAIVWEKSLETNRVTYVSEAIERLLGYSVSEWKEDPLLWTKILHPEDRVAANNVYMGLTKSGDSHSSRYRLITADGKPAWVQDDVSVVNSEGESLVLRGVMTDISSQMDRERELAQLSEAVNLSHSEIYIFDAGTLQFRFVNQGALENLGFDESQMTTMTPLDIKPDYDENSFRKMLEPLRTKKTRFSVLTTKHLRSDGSTYPVEIHLHSTEYQREDAYLAVVLDITKRRESEEFHQLMLQNVKAGLLLVNNDGEITLANQFVHEMFGYEESELLGLTIESLVPDEQRETHHALRMEFNSNPRTVHMRNRTDIRGLRKDGSTFHLEIHLSPSTISNKSYVLVSIIDITEQVEARQKAEKEHHHYMQLLENMHSAILIDDEKGKIVYYNQRFLDYFGLHEGDMEDFNIRELIAPDCLDRVLDYHDRRLKGQYAPEYHEFDALHKDGTTVNLQAITTLVFEKGEVTGTQSILLDVTEGKKIKLKMRRYQRHLADLVNSTSGIVWERLPEMMEFSFISKQVEQLLGFSQKQFLNNAGLWIERVHPFDRPNVIFELKRAAETAGVHRIEYRMISADGRVIWVDDQITVIYEEGTLKLLRGVIVDITERKTLLESIRNLHQREGEQVESERRRIAQDLHDDLSQRMAFVSLRLQTLAQQSASDSNNVSEELRELWDTTKTISTDIHNLAYELVPTWLRRLSVDEAISQYCDEFYKVHSIPVDFVCNDLPEEIPDKQAIAFHYIAKEALNNVHKHGEAGSVLVELSGSKDGIELMISDDGKGFDSSRERETESLGLVGMAERAYMAGGSFHLESVPGEGTRIRVVMPSACDLNEGKKGIINEGQNHA